MKKKIAGRFYIQRMNGQNCYEIRFEAIMKPNKQKWYIFFANQKKNYYYK